MINNSIVIGGTKGIGSVVSNILKKRGDKVYTVSRTSNSDKNIKIDLLKGKDEIYKKIHNFLKIKKIKFNNIVFSQRYRGENYLDEYNVTLHASKHFIDCLLHYKALTSSVVFISSISTETILDDQQLDYHTTRAGIVQMTKYYAVKLGKIGIRSNCILPTKIIKPENKKFYEKRNNKITNMMKKITPLSRMGNSKDVAYLAEFLTSDKSSFVTGVSIPLDGGARLQSHETIANIFKYKK